MSTIGIYCITNTVTGRKYVGQTHHLDIRFEQHLRFFTKT